MSNVFALADAVGHYNGIAPKAHETVDSFLDLGAMDQIIANIGLIDQQIKSLIDEMPGHFLHNGKQVAFVTLCTPSYYFGLIGLVRSLRRYSKIPLICLVDCDYEYDRSTLDNVFFVRVPRLKNNHYNPNRKEFCSVFSKLWAFGLSRFHQIVFLDSDVCILSPIDHLFSVKTPAFAPDYVDHRHTHRFNSGVFAISPADSEFRDLIAFAKTAESYDGGDQGVLNNFYAGRHHWLPSTYNTLKHQAHYAEGVTLQEKDIAIIHYIVKKPWEIKYREIADTFLIELESKWTENLTKQELLQLIKHWRREVFFLYERSGLENKKKLKLQRKYMKRLHYFAAVLGVWAMALSIGHLALQFFL
jgi:glycogenin glucosyltransferase